MKWYHWVVIALGAYLIFWRNRSPAGRPTLTRNDGLAINAILVTQDPGNSAQYDTDPKNYVLVDDQAGYPGWYRSSKDGSWYNPETKEFLSSATSPARYNQRGQYTTGEMVAPVIDLTQTVAHPGAPEFPGYNIP